MYYKYYINYYYSILFYSHSWGEFTTLPLYPNNP